MLRSFAILWFAVFTPLVLLIIPTDLNPVQAISKSMSGSFFKSVYSGSVNLIEEELLTLPPQEWRSTIEQHRQFFNNPLKLIHLEELQNKLEILNEVMAGEISFEFASPMALFKRVGDSQQVIYYALEESEESIVANQARGALYLAKQDLLKHPQDTWRERLRLNRDELPISVELVQKEQVPTMLLERLQSSTDWLASYTVPETSTIQLLTQVDNRHWILVTDEGSRLVKMKLTTYAFSALFGLVSATLILWVYPLSRDLKRLSRTASEFGQGILTRRAKTSSLSVVSQLSCSFNQMADSEIDDDYIGNSLTLSANERSSLKRDSVFQRATLDVSIPVFANLNLTPGVQYTVRDADGSAQSHRDKAVQLAISSSLRRHSFTATFRASQTEYDESNPVFDRKRDSDNVGIFAVYNYMGLFSWQNAMFNLMAGYSESDSDITFYDTETFFVATGVGFRF